MQKPTSSQPAKSKLSDDFYHEWSLSEYWHTSPPRWFVSLVLQLVELPGHDLVVNVVENNG